MQTKKTVGCSYSGDVFLPTDVITQYRHSSILTSYYVFNFVNGQFVLTYYSMNEITTNYDKKSLPFTC